MRFFVPSRCRCGASPSAKQIAAGAHGELVACGVDVGDVWHGPPFPVEAWQPGCDPERTSYAWFCSFDDPDANAWLVVEVTTHIRGRV
jgi:hypothetical protein